MCACTSHQWLYQISHDTKRHQQIAISNLMVGVTLEMIWRYTYTRLQCSVLVLYKRECTQVCTNLPNPSWMHPREGSGGAEAGRGGRGGSRTVLVRMRFHVADVCRGLITGLVVPSRVSVRRGWRSSAYCERCRRRRTNRTISVGCAAFSLLVSYGRGRIREADRGPFGW